MNRQTEITENITFLATSLAGDKNIRKCKTTSECHVWMLDLNVMPENLNPHLISGGGPCLNITPEYVGPHLDLVYWCWFGTVIWRFSIKKDRYHFVPGHSGMGLHRNYSHVKFKKRRLPLIQMDDWVFFAICYSLIQWRMFLKLIWN